MNPKVPQPNSEIKETTPSSETFKLLWMIKMITGLYENMFRIRKYYFCFLVTLS